MTSCQKTVLSLVHFLLILLIGVVTLASFSHGQMAAGPWGSNFLCVTDFPKVKIVSGNFHGFVKKNKRITHDSSRGKYYGLQKPKAAQPITRKWNVQSSRNHVLFTCCARLGAKSYVKTKLKVRNFSRILPTAVSVFQVLTLNNLSKLNT